MKFKYFFTVAFILSTFLAKAQMSDLAEIMGDKKLINQSNIYNMDNSLYGMMLLYSGEKVGKKQRRYEYLILDKNLNKIAKNEFLQRSRLFSETIFHVSKIIDDNFFLNIDYHTTDGIYLGPMVLRSYRKISLKNNKISNEFISKGEELYTIDWERDSMIKVAYNPKKRYQIIPLKVATVSGYLIVGSTKKSSNNYSVKALRFYDKMDNLQWTFSYNEDAIKKDFKKIESIYTKDDLAVVRFNNYNKNNIIGVTIIGIDLATGKRKFEYELDNEDSEFSHKVNTIRKYGDKIYLAGLYYPGNKNRSEFEKKLGVYKVTLDLSGKELFKKHLPWSTVSSYIDINKYAKVGKGYRLSDRDFFIFKDGSISYLSEKYKPKKEIFVYIASRSTDMVLMNFTSDLKVKDVKTIKKARSKENHYDYLFSQYVKEGAGCVFFFQDFKRDKEKKDRIGVLGINKYIHSEYAFEEVPIYSKKNNYTIYPMLAKEGYIILREYNEDDKYDQIRLEKVNY